MRNLVFAAFFSIFSIAAAMAQTAPPALISQCSAPGRCVFLNTGPCGSLITLNKGLIGVAPPDNAIGTRGIHGFCGFIGRSSASGANTDSPTYCETAADCSFTVDNCGYKAAVNAAHLGGQQAQLAAQTRSCGAIDTRQVTEERCVNNACVVTLGSFP